jgi:hypothetical protein
VPDIPEEPAPDAGMAPDMMMDPQPAPEPDSSGDYGLPDIPDEEEPGAQAPSADGLQFARAHEAGIMPESGAPPVRPAGGVVEPTDDKTSS